MTLYKNRLIAQWLFEIMKLDQELKTIQRIGPFHLERLQKLGIKTVENLLHHFPFRYDDFSNIKKINEVKIGEEATILGEVKKIATRKTFHKKMFITDAMISDETGSIKALWFNQPYMATSFKEGTHISCCGKVKNKGNTFFLSSPVCEKISPDDDKNMLHTQGLVPVYSETEGLTSRWLRYIIYPLLQKYLQEFKEFLPKEILDKKNLPEIKEAIFQVHFPEERKKAKKARERLAFEELFLLQLYYQEQKRKLQKQKASKIIPKKIYIKDFKKNLPFEFTDDQKKALMEILDDMQKDSPMSRLLEGEVGSGKTIVAALCAFVAAKNDLQAAIMAPTEILAEQHFKEISKTLAGLDINIGLLTSEKSMAYDAKNKTLFKESSAKKVKKTELLDLIKNSGIQILIGTHSIIEEKVKFKNLGLVVIDEQHRFGVEQRAKLSKQANSKILPHLLSMTATPIPRTLALALYGDLSISQIKQLPKGRKEIKTEIALQKNRGEIYEFLRMEIKNGRQGFVVCPLIEESEKLSRPSQKTGFGFYLALGGIAAAEKEFEKLKTKIFPELNVGLLHGRMKQQEKEQIMKDFKNRKIDILVTTPVVEVGVDVPNASVMIIEGSDRFGLAQLYQFRGRVGRGKYKSYCFLFSASPAIKTNQRLKAIVLAKNAFELAQKDLAIRGPGDFIGTRQSGIPDLAMASLSDASLIEDVKKEVDKILKKDPELKKYPKLENKLEEFKRKVFLE